MRRAAALIAACGVVLMAASPLLGGAQEIASYTVLLQQDRGRPASPLERHVTVHLADVSLGQALRTLETLGGVRVSFSSDIVPVTKQVSVDLDDGTLREAFRRVLEGTGLGVLVQAGDHLVLVKAPSDPAQGGTVSGRVTDSKTQQPIAGASVVLAGTRWHVTTDENGQFRIAEVTPGTYTVIVSRIGYARQSQSMTVAAGQEVTVDVALGAAATELEQVVVTGTVAPTQVKAVPTPVTVISASDIEAQHVRRIDQLFRQAVPSAVAWDFSAYPEQTTMSVRGASTLLLGGTMKVYVDGVEIADRSWATIDPSSIERIEVVRGPEAAAIYGADAISGVMQVFTKHGDPNLTGPQVDAQVALGSIQSPYGAGSALRQEYRSAIRGASGTASYNLGGGYTRYGDWLPEAGLSTPSAFGGLHLAQGQLTLDVSGRYYGQNHGYPLGPLIAQTGYPGYTTPGHYQYQHAEDTYGVHVSYAATSRWQHSVTVGVDEFTEDDHQSRPQLTTPADTFLFVNLASERKASFAYNTSVSVRLARDNSVTFTAGVDHYTFTSNSSSTAGALDTSGAIRTDPNQPVTSFRNRTTNTGYFTQAQLSIADALFLTGAVRAERNSNFGGDLGTPISPRGGISYVHQLGPTTVKVRGSYGEAIQAPTANEKTGASYPFATFLPNPSIGPERQLGGDGGVDVFFGTRGSFGVTYYDQTARDLIQLVYINTASRPQILQYQNVGRIKNTGWEFEGSLNLGDAILRGQYAITNSKVRALTPTYTGDLRVGDQVLGIPRATGGASLSVSRGRTSLTAGLTYVGHWTNYDWVTELSCFAGTGPCRASTRDYLIQYPTFLKANLSIARQITGAASAFLSVDNAGNSSASESSSFYPTVGRITMVGVRVTR